MAPAGAQLGLGLRSFGRFGVGTGRNRCLPQPKVGKKDVYGRADVRDRGTGVGRWFRNGIGRLAGTNAIGGLLTGCMPTFPRRALRLPGVSGCVAMRGVQIANYDQYEAWTRARAELRPTSRARCTGPGRGRRSNVMGKWGLVTHQGTLCAAVLGKWLRRAAVKRSARHQAAPPFSAAIIAAGRAPVRNAESAGARSPLNTHLLRAPKQQPQRPQRHPPFPRC